MQKLVITVTQEHIDAGQKCSMNSCPVALAMKEHTNKYEPVVGRIFAAYRYPNRGRFCNLYTLPEEVAEFVINFDNGLPVEPITFELHEYSRTGCQ